MVIKPSTMKNPIKCWCRILARRMNTNGMLFKNTPNIPFIGFFCCWAACSACIRGSCGYWLVMLRIELRLPRISDQRSNRKILSEKAWGKSSTIYEAIYALILIYLHSFSKIST